MDSTSSLIEVPQYTEAARAFHIANFVPVNWGVQDPVSRALVDFQYRREPQTTQWIRLALVGAEALGSVDGIVRALSSRELTASGTSSLDRLGNELAQRIGTRYSPGRLTKTRPAAPVKNAGTREARDRILRGAYLFDGTGLENTSTLLVIDDLVTTGATFGAIAAAIHGSLPGADVRFFALGRTDPWLVRQHLGEDFSGASDAYQVSLLGNAHLDPRYFTGGAPSAPRKARSTPTRPAPPVSRPQPKTVPPSGTPSSAGGAAEGGRVAEEDAVSPRLQPEAPLRIPASPSARASHARRKIPWRTIIIAAMVLGIMGVAFLLTQSPRQEVPQTVAIPPPNAGTFEAAPGGVTSVQEVPRPKPDTRPRGIINVPIVGLRLEPTITSGPVPDAIVKVGDRVIIVRTHRPDVGPDWILVETASRKRGWVIAPVITMAPGRSTTP